MFACLYSLSTPLAALVKVAEEFTPRFEVVGPLVMLDVSGLARLFGGPREIGEQLRRSAGAPMRVSIAPSQTAAALVALGRPGLTVVLPGEQAAALAGLQVGLLGELERIKQDGQARPTREQTTSTHEQRTDTQTHELAANTHEPGTYQHNPATEGQRHGGKANTSRPLTPPHVAGMVDVLPYFESCLDRTSEVARSAHACGGGWSHPREAHAARQMRRARRAPQAAGVEHAHAAGDMAHAARSTGYSARSQLHPAPGTRHSALSTHAAPGTSHSARQTLKEIQSLLDVLRRWGIKTLGALAALPAGDVYERLGGRGIMWQRLARGDDPAPLVPWVLDDPFEAALELEWPIEGLEPLSFVLARLFEPLAERLERADRGAAILHTHLHLVTREVHARTVQLPAPMRDPKTLRTLVLLDLESNPPSAAIDRVRVLVEPTPARVLQWALFARAQPSPEQVSTLLARLLALMGEGHVGSPQLVDSWRPGAFEMRAFQVPDAEAQAPRALTTRQTALAPSTEHSAPSTRHRAPSAEHSAPSTRHRALSTEHPVPSTQHRAPGTEHSAPSTQHRALSTEHPTPSTQHRAPNAEHSAPGTQHRAPNAEHSAPGTQHRAPNAEHSAPSTQHRAPGTEHSAPSTQHRAPGTEHPAPSTQHRAPGTEHPAPSTQHRALSTEHPAPSTQHRAPGTEHPAPSTQHRAPGTEHPAPSTQHRALSTEHPAPSTQHRAPGTEHPAPSTRHRAPSTEHSAPSTRHRAPSTEHPAPSTRHRAPSTEHPAPSTQHRAPGTEHSAPSTRHRALSTEHPAPSTQHRAPGTEHPAPSTRHRAPGTEHSALAPSSQHPSLGTLIGAALRRFRFPIPARVQVQEGRPVRVMVDRRGVAGGAVRQAAGPWRTSGEWWNDGNQPHPPSLARHNSASFGEASPAYQPPTAWDRDEWDIALTDGTLYRIFVEREVGQWFIEGVVD